MSETAAKKTLLPARIFRARWFFAGLLLGLAVMAFLGRRAGSTDYHPGFTRFHPAISPEASYYPTMDEMGSIVRARCRPDQVLVVVGGNSVLQGVAQPAEVMWSRKLQEQLGEKYCVINFAFRGATPTAGGAVVAEALRDEFPRQIYIANERPITGIFPLGNEVYRSIFWQAYYSGRLLDDGPRGKRVREYLVHRDHWSADVDIVGNGILDRVLRYHDYWNRVAFEHLNTVPLLNAPMPPAMFSPRKLYVDQEPDGAIMPMDVRYRPGGLETELKIIRGVTPLVYERTGQTWRLKDLKREELEFSYREAFPERLRARTLLLIGRDSPFYRRQLAPEDFERNEQAIHDTVDLLRQAGYAATEYGTEFTETDYADRAHLAPSGGEKLAAQVAAEISRMSEKLGYLK